MTLLSCDTTRPLIPRYLDGELAEPEAGPLRRHLLSCQGCRTTTQGEKAQRRWFEAEAEVTVPQGFAARVTQLAFAGAQPGTVQPQPEAVELGSGALGPVSGPPAADEPREERILPFVLRLTAAAAVLLIVLSGLMREFQVATVDDLSADPETVPTLEELDVLLEQLNEEASETQSVDPGR